MAGGVARGAGVHSPQIFRIRRHLWFERRHPNQNTVARLKSNILAPPKILGWLRHWSGVLIMWTVVAFKFFSYFSTFQIFLESWVCRDSLHIVEYWKLWLWCDCSRNLPVMLYIHNFSVIRTCIYPTISLNTFTEMRSLMLQQKYFRLIGTHESSKS